MKFVEVSTKRIVTQSGLRLDFDPPWKEVARYAHQTHMSGWVFFNGTVDHPRPILFEDFKGTFDDLKKMFMYGRGMNDLEVASLHHEKQMVEVDRLNKEFRRTLCEQACDGVANETLKLGMLGRLMSGVTDG